MPVPLIVTSLNSSTIARASEAAEEFLGCSSGQLIGRKASDFYSDPSDRPLLLGELRERGLVIQFSIRTIVEPDPSRNPKL